jgi:maleylpyruvate isomerase
VSFLRKVVEALSDGSVMVHDPDEVLRLASVPLTSSAIVTAYLADGGVEAAMSHPRGRGEWVDLFVRRSEFERASHLVSDYYAELGDLKSLHNAVPLQATLTHVNDASERLEQVLHQLDNSAVRRPSLLPDWTVGHVLAHIALNAEAFVRCADDLLAGRPGVMYPGGVESRSTDIDRLSHAGASTLADRVAEANARFAESWRRPPPVGACSTAPNSQGFSSATIIDRRLREIEVHGTDTGLPSLAPDQWSDAFVLANLAPQWATVARRVAEPVNLLDDQGGCWQVRVGTDATEPIERTRRQILAWILDRRRDHQLPTLQPWGDQSRWGR